jgi:hypothetical protein
VETGTFVERAVEVSTWLEGAIGVCGSSGCIALGQVGLVVAMA